MVTLNIDFSKPYDRSKFNIFLRGFLPSFHDGTEDITPSISFQYIQEITKLGHDNNLEDLPVYEIEHNSAHDARVSLTRESFRLMRMLGHRNALCIFINPERTYYRFSLIQIDFDVSEKGKIELLYSNPRRYSFLLGENSKVHTPTQYLAKKVESIKDLEERFSIEVVNEEFYERISTLFTELVGGERYIKSKHQIEQGTMKFPSVSHTEKQNFSIRLIGRIVFCWFLNKKKLIPDELLSERTLCEYSKSSYYHIVLEPLFFKILNTPLEDRNYSKIRVDNYLEQKFRKIPFLNGGLFDPQRDDYYEEGLTGISKYNNILKIPNDWFSKLFTVFNEYNFTVDENTLYDIELSIDPEMLGRIFEKLLMEINPDTGETARRKTGSYYTPRIIVEEMVNRSLSHYLNMHTSLPGYKIEYLLDFKEYDENIFSDNEKDEVIAAIDEIRVLDPACGSGAFPIGMLQKIVIILQKIDPTSKKWLDKQIANVNDQSIKSAIIKQLSGKKANYIHKKGILSKSIFGVDIQKVAVEISRLRCFLTLIVDEEIDEKQKNMNIEPLPNLDFKFICANSLVGLDDNPQEHVATQSLILELRKYIEDYFEATNKNKETIKNEIVKIQNELYNQMILWGSNSKKSNTQEYQLSTWDAFNDHNNAWFDSKIMFGINNGFDIIIGNPPYYSVDPKQKKISKEMFKYLKENYQSFHGLTDILVFFYEKALEMLDEKGIICFISKNRWYNSASYNNFRKLLVRYKIKIDDFDDTFVFKGVGVTTNIITVQKASPQIIYRIFDNSGIDNIFRDSNYKTFAKTEHDSEWRLMTDSIIDKMDRIEKGNLNGGSGHKITPGEHFKLRKIDSNKYVAENSNIRNRTSEIIPSNEEKEYIYRYASSGDIQAYHITQNDRYIINMMNADINELSNLSKYFNKIKRKDSGEKWYEYHNGQGYRNCKIMERKEKIIFPKRMYLNRKSSFALDNNNIIVGMDCGIIVPKIEALRIKYLLAILNSSLMWYYFRKTFKRYSGRQTIEIDRIPIPLIKESRQLAIEKHVEIIEKAFEINDENRIAKQKEILDVLIYKIFNLDYQEIRLVYPNIKISEREYLQYDLDNH